MSFDFGRSYRLSLQIDHDRRLFSVCVCLTEFSVRRNGLT